MASDLLEKRGEQVFPKLTSHHCSLRGSNRTVNVSIRMPFKDGKPAGPPEDFLTGFIADKDKQKVYGRPVGLAVMNDGALLVTDDASGVVWRVAPK